MDWDNIRYFLALARSGTVSAAAKELKVNHTTVTRRITAFEQTLHVTLFERKRDGYVTTDDAKAILPLALLVEQHATNLERQLFGRDIKLLGKLRITCLDSLISYLLEKTIAKFCTDYPGIELEIRCTHELLDLNNREADLAIRLTNEPPESLIGKKIATADFGVYGSRDYLQQFDEIDDPAVTALMWTNTKQKPAWLAQDFPNVKMGPVFDTYISMTSTLKSGYGITRLPCFIGDQEKELKRVATTATEQGIGVWILYHPDLRKVERVRITARYLSDSLTREIAKYALP